MRHSATLAEPVDAHDKERADDPIAGSVARDEQHIAQQLDRLRGSKDPAESRRLKKDLARFIFGA